MDEVEVPQTALDAPLLDRAGLDAWVTELAVTPLPDGVARPAVTVIAAGRPAAQAPGSRAPRTVAQVGSADAGTRGNWVPTGPRNITGRMRALAIHPTDPTLMYAGMASGGLWRSTDGGETWAPSWPDFASPSIAAISICRAHPEVIWVATGEHLSQILGNGIYRSGDGGITWSPNVAQIPGNGAATTFDALAAHPTNSQACWAVGVSGIYRTLDGGTTWTHYEAWWHYSDVAFAVDPAGVVPLRLFLVRGTSIGGDAKIIRLDTPDDPDPGNATIAAAIANVAGASDPFGVGPLPSPPPGTPRPTPQPTWPARGKIAICRDTPSVAYVRFALQGNDGNGGGHAGLFRTGNALAASGGAVTWTAIPAMAPLPFTDNYGGYAMAIGVNPANPNEMVTGMTDVFHTPDGGTSFRRVMASDLFPYVDRAQHGDVHATLVVAPPAGAPAGTPPTLWVANDGGLSQSSDWQTATAYPPGESQLPLPPGAVSWRKSFGITGSQMYSVTQSPLSPTTFGCGFQDNGVLMTAGGLTWHPVIGADGGAVVFDPDDPYKLLASYQSAIDEVLFPGHLAGGFALPGYPARRGAWPRDLLQGFLPTDAALFVASSAHHPRRGDRLLHARENRLYGTTETSGERWRVESAGRGLEIQFTAPAATLTAVASPGAARLGLAPQTASAGRGASTVAGIARLRSLLPAPYALQDGDTLTLVAGGTRKDFTFSRPADQHGAPWSLSDVAALINGPQGIAGLVARPCFWPRPVAVEVTTTALGAGARIALGGSALAPDPTTGLCALGLRPRAYTGTAGRPATVTLNAVTVDLAAAAGAPALELTLAIGDGPTRTVTFDSDTFANPGQIHAGELQQAIRAALGHDPATVIAHAGEKRLLITATAGNTIQLSGTAVGRLNVIDANPAAPAAAAVLECRPGVLNSFDLSSSGAALALTVNDGTSTQTLTFPGSADQLRALTSEELESALQGFFSSNALRAAAALEIVMDTGWPSDVVYSRGSPDTAYAGSTDGTLYRTSNDGGTWDTLEDAGIIAFDRRVKALAIHPDDPNTVFVGLEGRPTSDVSEPELTAPGLLFKTTDGGGSWSNVGGQLKDAAGGVLGAYAVAIDPGAPETVFAATEVGVYRSTDGAGSWQPFNEGLPTGLVRDLEFVPERRVLRAGVWGRGTYEREVGSPVPRDVSLYLRTSEYDNGSGRPPPRGPDPYAGQPRPLPNTASPDIKVSRDDPPSLAGVSFVDGVLFDEDIMHDDLAAGSAAVFVQLHNRGAFPASGVRAVCLWADAATGPPALPANFWTSFRAGPLSGTLGAWTVIGDAVLTDPANQNRDRLPCGYPRIQRFPVTWPADIATHRRVGILVLIEAAEDQLTATTLDIRALLDSERKAAYREALTTRDRDDQTIRIEVTSRTQFTVAAPPAPLAPATALLATGAALPIGPTGGVTGDTQASFALAPVAGNSQALTFALLPQTVTVALDTGIANPASAAAWEIESRIRDAVVQAGVAVAVTDVAIVGGRAIQLSGQGGTLVQVSGGTEAGNLGFAAPTPAQATLTGTRAERFALSAAAPRTLVLTVTPATTIALASQPGFNPAAAPARAVRRVLNRGFAAAHLPLRAVVPRVELWIRRSVTDIDGVPTPVAGHQLADLIASPTAVAAANQAALFDLVAVHGADPVTPNANNFLYLRTSNLGNVDLASADSRHRLYALSMTAAPITATQIGAAAGIQQAVPARSSTVVQFQWNPGPAATGDRLFVLAVADDQTHNPLTVPASFVGVDALDTFCTVNTNAAYRMFVVGA